MCIYVCKCTCCVYINILVYIFIVYIFVIQFVYILTNKKKFKKIKSDQPVSTLQLQYTVATDNLATTLFGKCGHFSLEIYISYIWIFVHLIGSLNNNWIEQPIFGIILSKWLLPGAVED